MAFGGHSLPATGITVGYLREGEREYCSPLCHPTRLLSSPCDVPGVLVFCDHFHGTRTYHSAKIPNTKYTCNAASAAYTEGKLAGCSETNVPSESNLVKCIHSRIRAMIRRRKSGPPPPKTP